MIDASFHASAQASEPITKMMNPASYIRTRPSPGFPGVAIPAGRRRRLTMTQA
jgi:hypothetical protein